MIFEYETLKVIWWLLVGVLLIGFAITDGFDLGVATLLPFTAKNDQERRVVINSIGPVWDGNQVWLITAGGALFAAWPLVYAAAFSGLYFALLLVLLALILRPVSIEFRSKTTDARWRTLWDYCLFVSGAVPALVFGVAFGNLLLGVPFHYDENLRPFYTGSFWALLNPFALLVGIVSLSMLVLHGALYMQLRTEEPIAGRARSAALIAGVVFIIAFAAAGVWVAYGVEGLRIVKLPDPNGIVTPLMKTVEKSLGAWQQTYHEYPWVAAAPAIAFAGAVVAMLFASARRPGLGLITSSFMLAGVILTAGLVLFPFIMPSSTDPRSSLTVWDATSSRWTLTLMFWAVVIFLPIVLAYTTWAYRRLRGKVRIQDISAQSAALY
jgi:cytochrome bd ubiquinol oxidase subunit II